MFQAVAGESRPYGGVDVAVSQGRGSRQGEGRQRSAVAVGVVGVVV